MEEITKFEQTVYFNDIPQRTNLMELFTLEGGEEIQKSIQTNEVIFVLTGSCQIQSDVYQGFTLEKGSLVFFPAACHYCVSCKDSIELLIVRINLFQRLAGCYSLEELTQESSAYSRMDGCAKIFTNSTVIQLYLESVCGYLKDNFINPLLADIKTKELLFLLNHYYSKEELAAFFSPILNKEVNFASCILSHWQSVKSINELIHLSGYCKTTFNKKFKTVFGCTPYKWLNDRRAAQIYYELSNTSKPFKKIAEEYGFNSQQHLNDYCVRYFKSTPGYIRLSVCK